MTRVRHFHKTLSPWLDAYEAIGWRAVARTWIDSCRDWSYLLEWTRDGEPVVLETL